MTAPTTGRGHEARLALGAAGLLADFNRAGILTAADVHVAQRLGRLGGETDEAVLLAVALVVRSTRHGSVVLDLSTAEATTSPEVDEEGAGAEAPVDLAWPADWLERCAASPLVGGPLVGGPLRMHGTRLWLARYWDQEEQVATELRERSAVAPDDLDPAVLTTGLDRLFGDPADGDQRSAAQTCAMSRVSVLAGGPGTGKTTTVSRLLALLKEQHPEWRVRLAAPTGKAAARLEEAVRSSTAALDHAEDRDRLGELSATTLHRLLGWRPEARSRFRHDRTNRLPAEVVVVDEASMVSLTMMARLLEALRPSTRLVLVGDPDQLASVEAGAVLGDLVDASSRVAVAALWTNRRFPATSGIARLAAAVQEGRGEDALAVLAADDAPEVELVAVADDAVLSVEQLGDVRDDVVRSGTALHEAAEAGDARGALAALDAHRLLCAHRRGPRGVTHWSALAERWVADVHPVVPRADGRYAGEPLLVTANDYEIELFNGDTGVVVADGHGGLVAVFGRGGDPIEVPLVRVGAVRPLHAMTVHRSQGSQFERITVVLPPAGSPLGTRETVYTAVTRATSHVRVIGSVEALVEAVGRPAARATGLRERLSAPR
jgi:exodeoxyribonuclease V alpha subunit